MAREGCWTWTAAAAASLILLMGWPDQRGGGRGRATVTLRESKRNGASTRVQTELKAKGLYRPGLPPGDAVRRREDAQAPPGRNRDAFRFQRTTRRS